MQIGQVQRQGLKANRAIVGHNARLTIDYRLVFFEILLSDGFERLAELFVELLHRIDVFIDFKHHFARFSQGSRLIRVVFLRVVEHLLEKQRILDQTLNRFDQIGLEG